MHTVVSQNRNKSVARRTVEFAVHLPSVSVHARLSNLEKCTAAAFEDCVQKAQGGQKFYVPQALRLLRKAAALRRGWQGGGQQRIPSGVTAQAVAKVVETSHQLFISALSRPHKAYHVTTAVCCGVFRRWHLAALFADEFIDIRCLLALGAAARGHT